MRKKITLLFMFIVVALIAKVKAQESYVNPLERWATHNVDELNTFATGEEDKARGKVYQFGRNIPLSTVNGETVPISDKVKATSPKDPVAWQENFLITAADNPDNWYNGGSATDTWKSIVAETVDGTDAPASYKGDNDGCPCPKGWRLPTSDEFNTLISKSKSLVLNETEPSVAMLDNITEYDIDIDGSGIKKNYTADYRVVSTVEVIGIRFKGTKYESAYRYQFTDHSVKISVKSPGTSSVDDIYDYWGEDAWADAVVRHLPRAGHRGWNSLHLYYGNPANLNAMRGYYWTTTAADEKVAWGGGMYLSSSTNYRTIIHNHRSRRHANSLRCVKEDVGSSVAKHTISNINVFSNSGKLLIQGADLEGKNIQIYALSGVSVFDKEASANKVEINNLPQGFYILKIGSESIKTIVK